MDDPEQERIFKMRRNLTDAGCGRSLIAQFLKLDQEQRRRDQYRLLKCHRAALLERLHHDQYKIDCLDHMIYTMEKEDGE